MSSQLETSRDIQWDLKTIYSSTEDFNSDVEMVNQSLNTFQRLLNQSLKEVILTLQKAGSITKDLRSYVSCFLAVQPQDVQAQEQNAKVAALESKYNKAVFALGFTLGQLSEAEMIELCQDPTLSEIHFFIKELRSVGKLKISREKEEVLESMFSDGYHAFWNLYQILSSKIKVGEKKLSVNQAESLLHHPDRQIRLKVFKDFEQGWKDEAMMAAQIINHLAGIRWKIYEQRKWEDILLEPLTLNRMQSQTLQTMWSEIEKIKPALCQYMQHKARLLGLEKLSWMDIDVPLTHLEDISYEQASKEVFKQFSSFHAKMGTFAKKALENRWVEAEDRFGKAAGGFCVFFRKKAQSRIFMTYKGTPYCGVVLAHELGHAYHNACLEHLPFFSHQITMSVGEIASTFAELIMVNKAIEQAKNTQEKQYFLDAKIQRGISYCMNVHARFLFETRFYQERKRGFVSPDRLCFLMETAQKEAFLNSLSNWHPYFWASKWHFYYTSIPFNNFPYALGFLMSNALYHFFSTKKDFGEKFDAFLEDTGRMSLEDLAKKHLQMDITKPEFWQIALKDLKSNIEEFLSYPA